MLAQAYLDRMKESGIDVSADVDAETEVH